MPASSLRLLFFGALDVRSHSPCPSLVGPAHVSFCLPGAWMLPRHCRDVAFDDESIQFKDINVSTNSNTDCTINSRKVGNRKLKVVGSKKQVEP